MRHLFATLFLAAAATVAHAVPIAVHHYDINDAVLSGHGNWNHAYGGTITPGASFMHNSFGGTAATYFGGSGTLNDGVIPNLPGNFPPTDTMLFVRNASDGTVLHPTIFLTLDFLGGGPWFVDRIEIWGGDLFLNSIPGAVTGFSVGLIGPGGGVPAQAFTSTAFGPGLNIDGEVVNDAVDLAGSGLENTPAWAVVLSDFEGSVAEWFSITEIRVFGRQVPANGVAEPPAVLLVMLALAALPALRRRR